MSRINFLKLKSQVKKEIEKADNLKILDEIFRKYLGEKGKITFLIRSLKKLSKVKRRKMGLQINEFKAFLKKSLEKKAEEIKEKLEKEMVEKDWIDVTIPGRKIQVGHLHPLTQVKQEIEEIFQSMGFSIVEGPEIENEWYNFDALNIPVDHPARDFWNTLWLKDKKAKFLLRTHTSPVQIHYLEKNQPPLRIIVPGRVFRHEATDASHEINFYQLEGLMVGENVSVANFKAIVQEFFKQFFKKPVKIRMRPSYFPFTEPSFEVDLFCLNCLGKGCPACQKTGWIEMMGAGMVHPNVFLNAGLKPKEWQGFAFGIGIERLAMMKYKINDIRLFYNGDLRFLEQF